MQHCGSLTSRGQNPNAGEREGRGRGEGGARTTGKHTRPPARPPARAHDLDRQFCGRTHRGRDQVPNARLRARMGIFTPVFTGEALVVELSRCSSYTAKQRVVRK